MNIICTEGHHLKRCKSSKGDNYFWKSWRCNTFYLDSYIEDCKTNRGNDNWTISVKCQEKYSNITYSNKSIDKYLYKKYGKKMDCLKPNCYYRFHTLKKYGEEYNNLIKLLYFINKINPNINLYDKLLPELRLYIFQTYLIYCKYNMNRKYNNYIELDMYPVLHCPCNINNCHKIIFIQESTKCEVCGNNYSKQCWENNMNHCLSCWTFL